MAPRFRILGKKRGDRRTGSRKLGALGEAAFFAALLLLGCAGLAAIVLTLVIPEYRVNHGFAQTQCTVRDKRLARKDTPEGKLFRPEITVEYAVGGETFVARAYDIRQAFSPGEEEQQALVDQFEVGGVYPCWYDPGDPKTAVLVRGYSFWFWLMLPVPISFLLIGGAGMIYELFAWGKSHERRAAVLRRAAAIRLVHDRKHPKAEYPAVPSPANITNSPGTHLEYRLPTVGSSSVQIIVWLSTCLAWNGLVAVFAIWAIRGHLAGEPDWFLTLFVTPFALVGLGLVAVVIRQAVRMAAVGPTLMEISDQPLRPGGAYQVFLSQAGRLKMKSLEVQLVCDEEATFRHGTDVRTETRRVFETPVFRREAFLVQHGVPFESQFAVEVPAGAMHSFHSDHNEVNWKLLVRGELADWPGYQRSFPVIVCPNGAAKELPATPHRNGTQGHE